MAGRDSGRYVPRTLRKTLSGARQALSAAVPVSLPDEPQFGDFDPLNEDPDVPLVPVVAVELVDEDNA